MNKTTSPLNTALIGGLCLSSFHFFWILIVASGWAQPLLDFIFKLHMLNSPLQVQPFSLVLAGELIAITFAIGAFYGLVFYFIKHLLKR
ncbi:MAG: hypothetical protein EBV25_00930 [Methylophilaceae bacterium]|nr:hypothetical protein [Methylophilaceae bacterium]